MRSGHPADLLSLAERLVAGSELAGESTVTMKTAMAREIIELAKTAKRPRGRQPLSGRERITDRMGIRWARNRKRELIAEGVAAEKAEEQAAVEASRKFKYRNLAATTIRRRMQGQL